MARSTHFDTGGDDYGANPDAGTHGSAGGGGTGTSTAGIGGQYSSPTSTQDYLNQMGVNVDESLMGFLPSTQRVDTAYSRMLEDQNYYGDAFGLQRQGMRTQGMNQMSQMFGGQGLMSAMGGGFGGKSRGIMKNMDQVRSAYSQDMAGGLLDFNRDMQQSARGYEDAQMSYSDNLVDRLIQLQQMYADEEDMITFT
tara:strand:+ start:517 stop:1104 length:588 start_codon:yes stop_codon:yes gene_type:complete